MFAKKTDRRMEALPTQVTSMAMRVVTDHRTGLNDPKLARDLTLAKKAAARDEVARRNLALLLYPRARKLVGYLVGKGPDGEDVVNGSVVHVLLNIGSFRGDCPIEKWAEKVIARFALEKLRSIRKHRELFIELTDDSRTSVPDDTLSMIEVRGPITECLLSLSDERRACIVLHHVQEYELAEIAEMTDVSIHTVRDRLFKGRKQLRKKLLNHPVVRAWAEGDER